MRRLPIHGWAGLALVALAWSLNWSMGGLRTHLLFFPLWLGYCLSVDALVYMRKGTSMLTRSIGNYVGLFIISAPAWWLFELFNLRTQNWFYDGRQYFSDLEYFILASISFSTVMPAVFGTAELAGTFGWIKRSGPKTRSADTRMPAYRFLLSGLLMMVLVVAWPLYFFPLVWVSVLFVLEPLNFWAGKRTLLRHYIDGDSRPVLGLWAGVLICAFFWEMWNFFSYPKWIYNVPFVDFLRIFEMPLLGYTGYIPFSMELFALYYFTTGLLGLKNTENYVVPL